MHGGKGKESISHSQSQLPRWSKLEDERLSQCPPCCRESPIQSVPATRMVVVMFMTAKGLWGGGAGVLCTVEDQNMPHPDLPLAEKLY